MELSELVQKIENWGAERNLHDDAGGQVEYFFREAGELARAHGNMEFLRATDAPLSDHPYEPMMDAIGDCAVVLIQIAAAHGLTFEDALEHAWSEIKDREGEVQDGVFVKEEDLQEEPR